MASSTEPKYLPPPENSSSLTPREARELFRINKYYMSTSGFCQGYVQTNLAVVPESCADEFEEFCRLNSGPLPLLYRSKPGERGAPPLADNSDVKTDLPRYLIFNNGRQVSEMLDLDGFKWEGYVSFYLGCSYSFEKPLQDAGIILTKTQQNKSVCIYKTNINCRSTSDKLQGVKMAVSMRPIRKEDLRKAISVTFCYPICAHGAPIHIGDPTRIGLPADINSTPDIVGNLADIGSDEVPVFWACGVTVKNAVEALDAGLTFTHYPGSMFITDVLTDSMKVEPLSEDDKPQIIDLSTSRSPYWSSLTTNKVLRQLNVLEGAILDDPSSCGVKEMKENGDFVCSLLSLSHAKSVAVIFGFPCTTGFASFEETDGPPGAFAIAQALQALGKNVVVVSENRNKEIVEKCSEYLVSSGALKTKINFVSCSELLSSSSDYDCFVAIERVGEASDGGHYSSSGGRDLTSLLEPIDSLFARTDSHMTDHVITIGIGDRGNELGLGKVRDRVVKVMKDGAKLGCTIASDRVILAGVSNWGGYAISAGLFLLANCSVHWRYVNRGIGEMSGQWRLDQFLTTDDQAKGLLSVLNQLGVADGISKSMDQSVDGLPLEVHLEKLRELRAIVTL